MEILFEINSTITPSSNKSQIVHMMYLPKVSKKICIEFSYEPKLLEDKESSKEIIQEALSRFIPEEELQYKREHWEDYYPLQNLITLSFDDAVYFRGAAHRHNPKQHLLISEDSASPGLTPGIIPEGMFKATLSVHALVTERCSYSIKVLEGGDSND
jgi:hypothetical protein